MMAVPISDQPRSDAAGDLVDRLLSEQHLMTPVADFARQHARGLPSALATHRELLPLTPLVPGEQYAFEVELDRCSGCKACVTACHSLNGLDETETWRDIGLLISPPSKPWRQVAPVQQTVTTACHHCVEPACLEGCPVLAYEKDDVTGIVRHLDDQCIGCQYCVLKCPYDVPKYNTRLGIVRKCDMCSSRVTAGEAPACAQACPNEAIRITKVSKSEVTIHFREGEGDFLQDAPAGDYTLPTTRYVNGSSGLVAADSAELSPQPAHWPLVLMLVLTQASVGAAIAASFVDAVAARRVLLGLASALGLSGLGVSVLHLGRPSGAWRSFLNLKRSWMSREIVVFGIYAPLLLATTAEAFKGWTQSAVVLRLALVVTALVGVFAVICSAMIYGDTRRDLWRPLRSIWLFGLSALLLGTAAALVVAEAHGLLAGLLALGAAIKLGIEIRVLGHVTERKLTAMKKSALLITGRFQLVAWGRLLALVLGGLGIPLLIVSGILPAKAGIAAFALLLTGEAAERYLFFRCVTAPKMPGSLPS
jgi:formate dehydrogenase iron-sulfur subunit